MLYQWRRTTQTQQQFFSIKKPSSFNLISSKKYDKEFFKNIIFLFTPALLFTLLTSLHAQ